MIHISHNAVGVALKVDRLVDDMCCRAACNHEIVALFFGDGEAAKLLNARIPVSAVTMEQAVAIMKTVDCQNCLVVWDAALDGQDMRGSFNGR